MMLWWMITTSFAGELRVVRDADTVESVAASLGDPALAPIIRELNGLSAGEQPEVGQLIQLPPASTAGDVDQRAVLLYTMGTVTVAAPGEAPVVADTPQHVPTGHVVCTGPDSAATLQLASDCAGEGFVQDDLTLMADTCVELQSVVASTARRASVVRVTQGSVTVGEPSDDQPSSVTVLVGDGVAVGEGGFRAHLEPDASLRTEALYNGVSLVSRGRQRDLSAGQGARVKQGGEITEPVALREASTLLVPAEHEALIRPVFTWTPDDAAFGYRLTIAGDPRMTRQVYAQSTPQAVHSAPALLLPTTFPEGLWWQVSTLDAFGFLGIPSAPRPLVLPTDLAP